MPFSKPAMPAFKNLALASIASLLLLAILASSLFYLVPPAFDAPMKFIYKIAFWLVAPLFSVFGLYAHVESPGHWPFVLWVLVAFLTPPFYWACWKLLLLSRRINQKTVPASKAATHGRRDFIKNSIAVAGLGAAGGVGAFASFVEPQALVLRRYRMPIKDLPPALDGLRIVQVSDTHLGPYIALGYLQEAVQRANALAPDLIVLTGDYVHRTPLSIAPGIGLLAGLEARLGIAGVLGNHDHWEGAKACRREFERIGVPLIDNGRLFMTPRGLQKEIPAPGQGFCLGGVGDLWTDEVRPKDAFAGVPDAMPRLLLSHNPDAAEEIADDYRIDLMFCGHTHGGQVSLPVIGAPLVPSAFGQRYAGGVCKGPAGPVVVSRGIGMAVLPVRFGVPPELVEVTLTRAV